MIEKKEFLKVTLIEFIDSPPVVNAASMLALSPDRVVLIGSRESALLALKERLFSLASAKMSKNELAKLPKIIIKQTQPNDIKGIATIIEGFLSQDHCVCDMLGGDEAALVALGMAASRYPVSLHTADIKRGSLHALLNANDALKKASCPRLTADEAIALYGGKITARTELSSLSAENVADIMRLWRICSKDTAAWNKNLTKIRHTLSEIGSAPGELNVLYEKPDKFKTPLKYFLKELSKARLIENLRFDGKELSFRFKDSLIRKCLTKDGLILEIYTSLIGKNIRNSQGEPMFCDIQSGVVIDWDGKTAREIHDKVGGVPYDTVNEIDALFMQGLVPVFISCKNGQVDTDELYKLNTVAWRFGGKYAGKILVSTYANIPKAMHARAKDMGITLLCGVDRTTDPKLCDGIMRDIPFETRIFEAVSE